MGEFLDLLKATLTAPVAIDQRFRLDYDSNSENVYVFFESVDDWQFYRLSIENQAHVEAKINVYYCGNKSSVWHAYTFAEQRGWLKNVICFVDKDLDDFRGSPLPTVDRIFVTNYYSIENYLCTRESLAIFLNVIVGLPRDSPTTSSLLDKFDGCLSSFQRAMLPVFAWAVAASRAGTKIVFANVGPSLDGCFERDDFGVRARFDLVEYFRIKCAGEGDAVANAGETDQWAATMAKLEPKMWLRGKYELWFTLGFMNEAWEGLVGYLVTDRRKIKKTLHLIPDNVFQVLGDKALPPQGLREFLRANIAA